MSSLMVSRRVIIPDPVRIDRFKRLPELGPKLLFFSGGTALNPLARTLKSYTHNSHHLITPFDSGGSSAALRQAFDMPAIGDLRSRLIALADETVSGHPEVARLFKYRLSKTGTPKELHRRLMRIVEAKDKLLADVHNPMRGLIQTQLEFFIEAMPEDFNLAGASIGNLILAGGYLNNHRHLDPIIFLFSKLVNTLGHVTAITDSNLHLAARLENGSVVAGQHNMTGKETPSVVHPISDVFTIRSLEDPTPAKPSIHPRMGRIIADADLICYPPGSFYSSLMANLLVEGVGRAAASNPNPKVYIPNLGKDPEQLGMSPRLALEKIIAQLEADIDAPVAASDLINFVVIDKSMADSFDANTFKQRGIHIIIDDLVTKTSFPYYDPEKLVRILLSLA
ncbi:GAK system CofD-like protein [Rhodobacteraceae bacterium RKSG542]|uniref:GAK system CofD-like protein n=1 Tax=Pseudovibrio flavus TaxID=2529854 RepID=UPI0012BCD285|nr:GAK system CofD-like protein [Pseudovibrio flavus]MTI16319.1 GAK system CofD-like protein [Pseudovibrio flavus]